VGLAPVDAQSEIPPAKPSLKTRLSTLLAEYGKLAIILYLVIFALVLAGFAIGIGAGMKVESAAGGAGVLGAAYLATKVTQPIRILATLALTPLVARALKWWRDRPTRSR
jgi:hypothetical protein